MKLLPLHGLFIIIGLYYLIGNISATSSPLQKKKNCFKECNLIIQNRYEVQSEFQRKASVLAVMVIRFNFSSTDKSLTDETHDYLYAWSRAVVGEKIFSLPLDYISACFFLPLILYDSLNINVTVAKQGCFEHTSKKCRQKIIFQTLMDFTQASKCQKGNCNTVCRRKFHLKPSMSMFTSKYSCCFVNKFHTNFTDVRSCLIRNQPHLLSNLGNGITVVTILAVIPLYFFIARSYISWQGR